MKKHSYNNFFSNFSSGSKFEIILALRDKPLSVTEIVKKVNGEQSAVSHNLTKLGGCNILNVKQKGKKRVYSLNKKTVMPMLNIVEKHVSCNSCKRCSK